MKQDFEAVAFVKEHGVVLASGKGPLPNLAEAVAGGPIKGSWWGHVAGQAIYQALNEALGSGDIVDLRLCRGKRTLVHRRVWPALARLSEQLPAGALASVSEHHTERGHHEKVLVPFHEWIPVDAAEQGRQLTDLEAIEMLGDWVTKEFE
jgi:hypothetical protein